MSPPLLWGRPTAPLTLTVHHAPHGLLTVVSGAAGALAAAPQLSLTAAAVGRDKATSHTWRLRVEGESTSRVPTAPVGQTHVTAHPHRPPHTPRAAHCRKRCGWRPRRRAAAFSDRRRRRARSRATSHAWRLRGEGESTLRVPTPLLWGRPTSPLTLTVHHAPHGLLTVVSSAAAALAAAPQLSLTAAAVSRGKATSNARRLRGEGESTMRVPTAPEEQTHVTTHPHRPPRTPRPAHCRKRCCWRPRRCPAAFSDRRRRRSR